MQHDSDQFIAYYGEVKDKLFTYFMVRLKFDRELAEDLFMDVVVKAYEHFSKFDAEKGSFKTWIFTFAHNHLVNFWRDKKKSISLEALEEEGISPAVTEMEETSAQDINNKNIRHILSLMKESESEIIFMRYMQDMSYAEIAGIIGKNEGAIRTSLSRALEHFAELYKKIYS
jgi:RNA polymerase sigma-70 factor, ECF subfamily